MITAVKVALDFLQQKTRVSDSAPASIGVLLTIRCPTGEGEAGQDRVGI
jgi:hypothetical protein